MKELNKASHFLKNYTILATHRLLGKIKRTNEIFKLKLGKLSEILELSWPKLLQLALLFICLRDTMVISL